MRFPAFTELWRPLASTPGIEKKRRDDRTLQVFGRLAEGRSLAEARLELDIIGAALATRDLLTDLRSAGLETRGPAAFSGADRSRFLQALDAAVHRVRKSAR